MVNKSVYIQYQLVNMESNFQSDKIPPMQTQPAQYLIRSRKQMAALKAPTRQEIVDVLGPMGVASVADLASALGRPADALYYHLRILLKAGLVLEAGERKSGVRSEALYRTIAPSMSLVYLPGKSGNSKDVTPIIESMLRLTARDFRQSFDSPTTVVEGVSRELWAIRRTGWLTEQQVAAVNRQIERLQRTTLKSAAGNGKLFGLTMVLAPLAHRTGKEL